MEMLFILTLFIVKKAYLKKVKIEKGIMDIFLDTAVCPQYNCKIFKYSYNYYYYLKVCGIL